MTYPKQTTRKRGKRSGNDGESAGAARGAGGEGGGERAAEREKERKKERGRDDGRTERDGERKERMEESCIRAHTRPRGCNTRMARSRELPSWREKEECARNEEGYAERSLFFVLFFIVR